jgi:SagB-type dehydrogenase family enzyme
LWSAYGHFNDRRNVPQIGYDYSLIIFAVNETGSYRYIPENNSLVVHDLTVNKETIRPHDSGWPSNASVVLVVVWNETKMGNGYFASAEAGCLVQNVYLAAASLNLGTCCVGSVNSAELRNDLKLPSTMIPLLVMPLGYPTNPYPAASPNYDVMTGNLPLVQYSELSFKDSIRNMLFTQTWPTENLSLQKLSQLLWAAYGYTNITYEATYHRTTPSAYGIYPLVIYVSNATGIYQYLPENHSTVEILQGDRRFDIANACSNQSWVAKAPAIFLIVYNSSYNNGTTGDRGGTHEFIEVDAGAVIQQLFLEASAWNLSVNIVSQGLEDWNGTGAKELRGILNLSPSLIPLCIVPIGSRSIDSTEPTIGTPSQNPGPTAVGPYQNVTVTVDVVDEETGVREVILSYSINEGQTWINATMKNISNNTYTGEISGFEAGTHVQYKIIAYDNANNKAVEDKNGEYYVYTVIPEFYDSILLILMIITLIAIISIKMKKGTLFFKHLKSNCK